MLLKSLTCFSYFMIKKLPFRKYAYDYRYDLVNFSVAEQYKRLGDLVSQGAECLQLLLCTTSIPPFAKICQSPMVQP